MKAVSTPVHIVECLSHSDHGGGQAVVYGFISQWRSFFPDEKISVILPPNGIYRDRFKNLGVAVYEMHLDRISLLTFIRMVILLWSLRPTVVHSHGKGAGFYTRSIPRYIVSAKRIHTYHGFHLPDIKVIAWIYRVLESFLLRSTDVVISISKSEAFEIRRTFRIKNIRIKIVENIVNSKLLKLSVKEPIDPIIASFFKLNKRHFIVTMIARYDKVKNYSLALESCSQVLRQNANAAFIFVGINTQDLQFVQLEKEYSKRICGVGVQPSTAAILKRSHAVLLTSHKEGLPIIFQEAFCFAKPAIATNVNGINELVVTDFNGILCSEDPYEIAAGILKLIKEKSFYRNLCAGASQTAKKYNVKKWIMNYHKNYSL